MKKVLVVPFKFVDNMVGDPVYNLSGISSLMSSIRDFYYDESYGKFYMNLTILPAWVNSYLSFYDMCSDSYRGNREDDIIGFGEKLYPPFALPLIHCDIVSNFLLLVVSTRRATTTLL